MKIAVLSGKGGTGKTLVSVNLAFASGDSLYLDCDVEEPNGHLFFKPESIETEDVKTFVPFVDEEKCVGCRRCVDFCKFNAMAFLNNKVVVFEDVCHACGACMELCPVNALEEKLKTVGQIKSGISGDVKVISGILNMGEASGVNIIKQLLTYVRSAENHVIIDCPPGSACTVMESIQDADYCVLVTEPTLFGAHNLKMVYDLTKIFEKKCGVIINKYVENNDVIHNLCKKIGVPILNTIPYEEKIANINSNGNILAKEDKQYYVMFKELLQKIVEEVNK